MLDSTGTPLGRRDSPLGCYFFAVGQPQLSARDSWVCGSTGTGSLARGRYVTVFPPGGRGGGYLVVRRFFGCAGMTPSNVVATDSPSSVVMEFKSSTISPTVSRRTELPLVSQIM